MKKLFFAFTALLFLPLTAQGIEVSDIDSIMEDNSFQNVSNRYDSVLFYFFPEATTRLGMTLGNRQLNIRTRPYADYARCPRNQREIAFYRKRQRLPFIYPQFTGNTIPIAPRGNFEKSALLRGCL